MKRTRTYGKPLILLLVAALVLTYALPWLLTRHIGTASAGMVLSFDGIGKGLDPKGNPFNINDIKSDEVLNAALKKAKLEKKLSPEELKKLITIRPVVSAEALNRLTSMSTVTGKTENVAEKTVHTGHYIVGIRDEGLPSYLSVRKLENCLMESYEEALKAKYLVDAGAEPIYSQEQLLGLDYPEQARALENEADTLARYAASFTRISPKFQSAKTGHSFADLSEQAKVVRDTDVKNISGVVNYYMLTKDAAGRAGYEEIRLRRANLLLSKATGNEWTVSNAVNVYDNNSNYLFTDNSTAAVSTQAQENKYYAGLTNQLTESKNQTIKAKYDVAEIQQNMDRLKTVPLPADEYALRIQSIEAEVGVAAERMKTIRKSVTLLAAEDYDTNIGSKVKVTRAGYDVNGFGNPVVNFILLAVLALLLKALYRRINREAMAAKIKAAWTKMRGLCVGSDYGKGKEEQ